MSKSQKNIVDPESMIKIYGADAVRWFILSDSPPERDVQWSTERVSAAHKFIQRIWNLSNNLKNKKNDKPDFIEQRKFLSKFNEYIFKLSELIENFQLNVAIAKIHEMTNLLESNVNKKIDNKILLESLVKFLKIMMPFSPHLSCECLSKIEGNNFFENIKWPEGDESLLEDQEVTLVVQINGKKRGLIVAKKNLSEKDVLNKAKKMDNIKKNLKDKKVIKNIFVKNKIINFITT